MNKDDSHDKIVLNNVSIIGKNSDFQTCSNYWLKKCIEVNYPYSVSWMGRPIIQIPQDL